MELINLKDQANIKSYFLKVKELQASGDPYPVDLDEVWPLCYARKEKAVNALLENFLQDVDFIFASPFGEAKRGGLNKRVYRMTSACMEHFIARKVKEVFEVYRQVFHQATTPQPQLSELDVLLKSVQKLIEQDQRLHKVEDNVDEMKDQIRNLEAKQSTRSDYFAVMGYAVLNNIKVGLQLAATIGTKAKAICKANGYPVEQIPDPRFGRVNTYPLIALKQAFDAVTIN